MIKMNDSNQEELFTTEQKIVLSETPWFVHVIFGCIVGGIGVFGTLANSVVLIIFSKYRRLRTTANIFVMNLAVGDLLASLLHPLAAYSCFRRQWSFGLIGCQMYGMSIAMCGFNSIITLTVIAYERYQVIANSAIIPVRWQISKRTSVKVCIGIWIYCIILVSPPLFGVSRYVPEGVGVICSWDYTSRTIANRTYYILLVVFGFLLPGSVIATCYACVYKTIISHDVTSLVGGTQQQLHLSKTRRQMDIQTAQIIGTLILLFITAWTPYTVVSFIGQFGPENSLTPLAMTMPAFFAKGAVAFDPLVYAFSHPRFSMAMSHFFAKLCSGSNNDQDSSLQRRSTVHLALRRRPTVSDSQEPSAHSAPAAGVGGAAGAGGAHNRQSSHRSSCNSARLNKVTPAIAAAAAAAAAAVATPTAAV